MRRLPTRYYRTFAWGNADHAQLSLPPHTLRSEDDTFGRLSAVPHEITELRGRRLSHLSMSASHLALITADTGQLHVCGSNSHGQLGLNLGTGGTGDSIPRLRVVPDLPPLSRVACGGRHTLALSRDGLVFSFGDNGSGQLGTENTERSKPALIRALAADGVRAQDIIAGDDFSLVVCDMGRVYSWGTSYYGALGHASDARSGIEGLFKNLALSLTSASPYHNAHPRVLSAVRDVKTIVHGKRHVVATDKSGKHFAWGHGRHYLLGNDSERTVYIPQRTFHTLTGVRKLVFGNSHALALTTGGVVLALGENEHGCLGVGRGASLVDVQVNAIKVQGLPTNVVDITAGWNVSAAVTSDGKVFTWGCPSAGALGLGDDTADVLTPTQVTGALKTVKVKRIFCSPGATAMVATGE